MTTTREIVVPGDKLGDTGDYRPGTNTYTEGNDIFALRLGVKSVRGDRINVISLSGRYEPYRGDMVIGTVAEAGPSNWYINIGAANDVGMHVNDVPWRVEFGETAKYLGVGDTVLLKIVHVDELRKAQVSMKDRQCKKLTGGLILEVNPARVPRIVGRAGSMIQMLKDMVHVRIFVGQNGVIWLDGEQDDVALALEALEKIQAEAHTTGLTERMKAWLEERRPQPADDDAEEAQKAPADVEAAPEAPEAPDAPAEPEAQDEEEGELLQEAEEAPPAPKPKKAAKAAQPKAAAEEPAEDDAKEEAPKKKAPAKRAGRTTRARRPSKKAKKD